MAHKNGMTKFRGFGHYGIAILGVSMLALSACTTTPLPQQRPGPVVQRPPQQQAPRPDPVQTRASETETKNTQAPQGPVQAHQPQESQEVRQQPTFETENYFNNREGLTPPHMNGRDTKRLAILLPFSAKSTRLREEAASMLQAAELAVFNREEPDVLLMALDTRCLLYTSPSPRDGLLSRMPSSA